MSTWRKPLLAALLLCCAVAIAACGSSNSSSSSASTTSSSSATSASTSTLGSVVVFERHAQCGRRQALVPSAIKSKGTLTVAADASYAPDEFIGPDGHTVVGMDADLSKALAAEMGLKANVVNATFDTIIPGLAAGKYDMGASSFSDTQGAGEDGRLRRLLRTSASRSTRRPQVACRSADIADICGKSVSVESGTTEEADAKTQSAKCTKAGKPAVNVLVFPTQTAANLAAVQRPCAARLRGHAGRRLPGEAVKRHVQDRRRSPTPPVRTVSRIPKNGLDKAVLAALQELVKNGTYASILAKWGLSGDRDPGLADEDQRGDELQRSNYGLRGGYLQVSEERPTGRPDEIKAVPVRRPGRWIAAAIVLVIAASIVRSDHHRYGTEQGVRVGVGRALPVRLTHPARRSSTTIYMTFLAMLVGIMLGVVAAVMRLSPNPIVSSASWLYIWFFRGTPLLVQILFWYNIAAAVSDDRARDSVRARVRPRPRELAHHAARRRPAWRSASNEGAYMSEIVRAGIISVDEGQTQAAQSLGM